MLSGEGQGLFDAIPAFSSGCEMWTDPGYPRAWRDLRRREFLFWFFVLSYLPGILLIIVISTAFGRDAPKHSGMYFSVAWLAAFVVASLYHQNFRCPRCRHFFFRRSGFVDPYAANCVNCSLARGAPPGP
jgi:hypothetical protein